MNTHLSRLQQTMQSKGTQAVLVTSEINQRYLTGFPFTDGYVLVLPEQAYLITDFRYVEAAQAQVDTTAFDILTPKGGMLSAMADILKETGVTSVSVEEATLSLQMMQRLQSSWQGVTLNADASALIDTLRLYKDEGEIAKIQAAQDIADAAFSHILTWLTPDRTEVEVALELEFFMRAHGAECVSFETIAVSGTASSMPHGVPRPVTLEKGFLTMDFGARVDGYCSDMTRTVVIGRADEDMRRLYETVLHAQTAALEAACEGASCHGLDKIARDIIEGAGYHGAFGHSLGHGVGMYIHESPRLSPAAPEDEALKRGHVVTFEPGIYLAGKYGCRIEDMVAILPDGRVHNFTHSDKQLIEIV